jgi:membrane protease YdiL (CAAX protease family)
MSDATLIASRLLLGVVLLVLFEMGRAALARQFFVPRQSQRPLQFDWVVLAVALLFISLSLSGPLVQVFSGRKDLKQEKGVPASPIEKARPGNADENPTAGGSDRIVEDFAIRFFVIAVLIAAIASRPQNRPEDYGIDLRGWLAEARFGGLAYLASLPFTFAIMIVLTSFRTEETQNPLLILVRHTESAWTLVGVILAAVVTAPLTEELLFRVAFQGQLETRLRAGWAVAIPALVFVSVHGIYDALPLLPLALLLGILHHWRRSYIACVTTHALFNATFLILALWPRAQPEPRANARNAGGSSKALITSVAESTCLPGCLSRAFPKDVRGSVSAG